MSIEKRSIQSAFWVLAKYEVCSPVSTQLPLVHPPRWILMPTEIFSVVSSSIDQFCSVASFHPVVAQVFHIINSKGQTIFESFGKWRGGGQAVCFKIPSFAQHWHFVNWYWLDPINFIVCLDCLSIGIDLTICMCFCLCSYHTARPT